MCIRDSAHCQRQWFWCVMTGSFFRDSPISLISVNCNVVIHFTPSLRSYNGNCKENVTLKLNFALSWISCDYSMLITLYEVGGMHFHLLGTNGFHAKAKNERFTAASSRCRQNLKYENFTSSFDRLRQNICFRLLDDLKNVEEISTSYFCSCLIIF